MSPRSGSAHDGGAEPGLPVRALTWLLTLVVVIVTLAFSVFVLAAATGNLGNLRNLVGL